MPHCPVRALALVVLLAALASAADPAAVVATTGPSATLITGESYRFQIRGGESPLSEVSLRQGDAWLPILSGSSPIIWGEGWKRVFDGGSTRQTCSVSEQDGVAVVHTSSSTVQAEAVIDYRCRGDRIEVDATITLRQAVAPCRRVSVEIGPVWERAAGANLAVVAADGAPIAATMPSQASQSYVTVHSGRIRSLELGMQGGGLALTGDVTVSLEQIGSRFRWHLAAPASVNASLPAGSQVKLSYALAFRAAPAVGGSRQAAVAIDAAAAGRTIPAETFGAQLYGFTDPARPFSDEQLRYMTESGVSFFRLYLSGIFGYSEPDPLWPSPTAPCDYTRGDTAIAAIRGLGIDVVPVCALYCPPWLSSRRPSPEHRGLWIVHRAPPTDNAAWSSMVAGLVRHYNVEKGFGLKLWQIGNEPDDEKRYWVGGTLPEFAAYFTTAAQAMKAADPTIRISGPDLANLHAKAWPERTVDWRTGFMAACAGQVDDFSFNRYGDADFAEQLAEARRVAGSDGRARSVWVAEYHVSAVADTFALGDFRGALFMARALTSLIGNGADRASVYAWGANRPGSNGLGLFDEVDGRWRPLPTYHAFRLFAGLGRLKGATLLKAGDLGGGLEGLAARHADGMGWSLMLIAGDPASASIAARISLAGAGSRPLSLATWQLRPDHEIVQLPERRWSPDRDLEAEVPGQSITLMVLRP